MGTTATPTPRGLLADWLGKPASHGGGLGFGDRPVTIVAAVLVVVLVAVINAGRPRRGRRG